MEGTPVSTPADNDDVTLKGFNARVSIRCLESNLTFGSARPQAEIICLNFRRMSQLFIHVLITYLGLANFWYFYSGMVWQMNGDAGLLGHLSVITVSQLIAIESVLPM